MGTLPRWSIFPFRGAFDHLALHVGKHLAHCRMVRPHDNFLRGRVTNTPEDTRRLRDREREVITGNGSTPT
nr:hypothetical protein [Cryobacterium serini]